MARYLLDTDVIIDFLRGNQPAIDFLENLEGEQFLSVITVAEIYAGVKGSDEEKAVEQLLLAFDLVPVDQEVARQGGLYRRDYHPSHGTGLADALIAATADRIGATLLTFNQRHYPMLQNTRAPYQRI